MQRSRWLGQRFIRPHAHGQSPAFEPARILDARIIASRSRTEDASIASSLTGETIVLEGMIGSRTGLAIPATVVDLGISISSPVSFPLEWPILRLVPDVGSALPRVLPPNAMEQAGLTLRPHTRSGGHVLYVAPVSDHYAVYVRWSED